MKKSNERYTTFPSKKQNLKPKSAQENNVEFDKLLLNFNLLLKQNLDKPFSNFVEIVLNFLSSHAQACTGIYYSHHYQKEYYQIEAIFGNHNQNEKRVYHSREGLVGQVIQSGKMLKFLGLPPKRSLVNISNYQLSINSICIFPIIFNNKIYGAIYFGFLRKPTQETILFLEKAVHDLGVMIENVYRYKHVRELLKESERQKDELSTAKELLDLQAQKTDEAYNLLQINYTQLMKSIKYAQKIQNAFLPQSYILKNDFSDFFVFYLPKDTVSGDFYWYHKFLDRKMIAVGDCTGHGVPGAFMSLFAINVLNKIIVEEKIVDPCIVLENLRQEVKTFLQRDGKGLQDGLDISICSIQKNHEGTSTVIYSGAKSAISYTKEGELISIKGNRNAIGGIYYSDKPFTSQKIQLKSGEKLYFYTDGITDICNDQRKSYGKKSWHAFLLKNMNFPMENQKLNLQQEMTDYQGVQDQRDDVTVLGIQLN